MMVKYMNIVINSQHSEKSQLAVGNNEPVDRQPVSYRRPGSSERRNVVREVSGSTPRPDQHSGS